MREILFRGKHANDNKWYYGNYLALRETTYCTTQDYEMYPNNIKHYIVFDEMTDWGLPNKHKYAEVFSESVGMSLEMHDRHNVLTFENDIIEFIGTSTHRYLIWWNRECSMMTAVPLDGIYFNGQDYGNVEYPNFDYYTFCLMMQDPWGDFRDIKVIGNIYDNPELLEGVT